MNTKQNARGPMKMATQKNAVKNAFTKKQRIIPSIIDVKTDLHRLKVLLEDKNTSCSSILRMKERYGIYFFIVAN